MLGVEQSRQQAVSCTADGACTNSTRSQHSSIEMSALAHHDGNSSLQCGDLAPAHTAVAVAALQATMFARCTEVLAVSRQ